MTRTTLVRLAIGLAAVVAAVNAGVSAAMPEQVRVETGAVSSASGISAGVRVFKGIPFAAPPVGANRWRAPQPAAKWEGVRPGDVFGNRCTALAPPPAPGRGGRGGAPGAPAASAPAPQPPLAEDCLYLNVWTSATSAADRRPVMVWIYGGAFTGGAGSEQRYDGDRLSAKGPVVVTFNYRLGPLGFLAHPELTKESGHNASGNYGMMDAIAALQWVKRNIRAFGGDPDNVTIFGESAGGMMVSSLVGSSRAKGLFHRAIAQSGGWMGMTMAPMSTLAQFEQAGAKWASELGATSIADLRKRSTEELSMGTRPASTVIVDGYLVPEDQSITFAQGRQNAVEVIAGSNADEGTFFPGGAAATSAGFKERAQQKYGELTDGFLKLYPAGTDADAASSFLAVYADETSWNMRQFAALQNKRGKKSYAYYFTRVPRGADGAPSPRRATHTVEIQYAFNNPTGLNWEDTDKKIADTMSSYWVNFATTGDPNGSGLPTWPVYKDHASGRVMVLGETTALEPTAPAAKLTFYDAAYARQQKR